MDTKLTPLLELVDDIIEPFLHIKPSPQPAVSKDEGLIDWSRARLVTLTSFVLQSALDPKESCLEGGLVCPKEIKEKARQEEAKGVYSHCPEQANGFY